MTIWGLDLLGLGSKNWAMRPTIASWPKGWALGAFDCPWPNAFGDPRANVRRIIETCDCPIVRIHLYWSYQHTICPLKFIGPRIPLWEQMAKRHPKVKFYLSPSCEYQEKSPVEVKKRVDAIRRLAPHCEVVLAPMASPVVADCIVEQHGQRAKAKKGQFVSLDGSDPRNMTLEQWRRWKRDNQSAAVTFMWLPIFNMAEGDSTPVPSKRTASPDKDDFQTAINMALDN